MWSFIRRVLSSRLAQLFAAAHLLIVVYDFAHKDVQGYDPAGPCVSVAEWQVTGSLIAGRFFHFTYESALHQLTAVADLPSLLVSALITAPVYRLYPDLCVYTASWIDAAVLLAVTSCQWLLIGFAVGRLFKWKAAPLR